MDPKPGMGSLETASKHDYGEQSVSRQHAKACDKYQINDLTELLTQNWQ